MLFQNKEQGADLISTQSLGVFCIFHLLKEYFLDMELGAREYMTV